MTTGNLVYVLDSWTRPQRRQWREIIPSMMECNLIDTNDGWLPQGDFQSRSLIIAHRSAIPTDCRLIDWTSKFPNLYIVVISGDAQTEGQFSDHIYYRRTTMGDISDKVSVARINRFIEHFFSVSSSPKYALLEPDPLPDHLIAVYLIALATQDGTHSCHFSQDELRSLLTPTIAEEDPWNIARNELHQRLPLTRYSHLNEFVADPWPDAVFEGGKPRPEFLNAVRSALSIAV